MTKLRDDTIEMIENSIQKLKSKIHKNSSNNNDSLSLNDIKPVLNENTINVEDNHKFSIFLWGHSMGGLISSMIALEKPNLISGMGSYLFI